MIASYNFLIRNGWSRKKDMTHPSTYPASDSIVLEKGDKGLVFSYAVRDDDSDYPGDNVKIHWQEVTFEPVVQYKIKIVK